MNCVAESRPSGNYKLLVGLQHVDYGIVYFFHGPVAAILAYGLTKQHRLPAAAIETALVRKRKYEQDA